MKKLLIALLTVFILFIGILAIIPIIFEKQLTEKARQTLSESIEADIRFSGLDINLFRNFPNVQLKLNDLHVSGVESSKTDTLFLCKEIETKISLSELFSGNFIINRVKLVEPQLCLAKNQQGIVNWPTSSTSDMNLSKPIEANNEKKASSFGVQIEEVRLENGTCSYFDMKQNQLVKLSGINTTMSGNIKGDEGDIAFRTDAILDYTNEGELWYKSTPVSVSTKAKLLYEFTGVKFEYLDLAINDFPVRIKGGIIDNTDNIDYSLELSSKQCNLQQLLKVVPSAYANHFASYPMSGEVMLKGNIVGIADNDGCPAVDVQLLLKDGTIRNTEKQLLDKINGSVSAILPLNEPKALKLSVSRLDASMSGNPLKMSFDVTNLMGDGKFRFSFNGHLNMQLLHELMPSSLNVLEGTLNGELKAAGSLKQIEKKQYDKIKTDGSVELKHFKMQNKQMSKAFSVEDAKVKIESNKLTLNRLTGVIGQSRFNAVGNVSNFYGYLFQNETLKAALNINAPLLNMNDLLTMSVAEKKDAKDTITQKNETSTPYVIPANIRFITKMKADKVIFDNLLMERVVGSVSVENSALKLDKFSTRTLGGSLIINGKIVSPKGKQPHFNLHWNANGLDINKAWNSLKLFRRFVPIAAKSTGTFSTRMNIGGAMSSQWLAIPQSLNGKGTFATQGVNIVDSKTLSEVGKVISVSKLKEVDIKDLNARFTIANGALIIPPFKTEVAKQPMVVSGTKTFDDKLDFNIAVDLDRKLLKKDYDNILSIIPGSESMKTINADVKVSGTVKQPVVKLDVTRAKKQLKKQLKKTTVKQWAKKLKGLFK